MRSHLKKECAEIVLQREVKKISRNSSFEIAMQTPQATHLRTFPGGSRLVLVQVFGTFLQNTKLEYTSEADLIFNSSVESL
ncbi:Eukaryotic translation initiation factor 4e1a-binding protein [Echinococcus multilocularis]|uniref:Eukaryotic translation initiation factor 4e1a-binding protein n=1 Tax=Echinococcus multilocularis TaxID=6211 RepID=A0A0S4MMV9_ECHMU|nr:Eukaryotic translation initiation factor 4e1a-binding protein [Echinococcus multilocularis]